MRKIGVECRDLCLRYGQVEVLKGICLDVQPGEFFALLGPSGSGKSSLLRAMAGFTHHQSGQLLLDGRDVSSLAPWQRRIGMVFQNYALWPHLSVWENIAFGLFERKMEHALVRTKVAEALALVGLEELAERRTTQLSGGQQQRVALARTLVTEPQVLLLDEPLSNLDRRLRLRMRKELVALQRRLGITTVFVTHDQEEAMSCADRIAVLDQGVIQQVGAPMALHDYPSNPFVANFLGTMNSLPGQSRGLREGVVVVDVDGLGELRSFRPHTVRLDVVDAQRDARYLWVPGVVETKEFLGAYTRYGVRVGGHRLWADRPHYMGVSGFAAGVSVALGLEPSRIRLFVHEPGKHKAK
jgi:iron(III) transport system ATP-binding protein